MTRRHWTAALAGLVLLSACGSTPEPVEPSPVALDGLAPSSDTVADADLPLALSGLTVLDPGWDRAPQELDGYLLGLDYPEDSEPLRFVAAREDGTLLWQAERPPSCAGFALSTADGRPVAVLTDVEPGSDTVTRTSATAYDLATGELLWGPVAVPGPHQGPGTVYAAPAPGATMGDTGPRTALDPATGEVLVSEDEGTVVVGEYDGVVLTAEGETLTAGGPGTAWEVSLADLGLGSPEVAALAGVDPPPGTALVAERGQWAGVLLDLENGELLADGVSDAVTEPLSGTLVTVEGEHVTGYPDAGQPWQNPSEGMRLSAAGNVFAYLRSDSAVRALNVVTGEGAVAFEAGSAAPAVPVLVTAGGATVVEGAGLALVVPGDR